MPDLSVHESIRARLWERKFPGSIAEIKTIFGTELPTVSQISKWRMTWNDTTDNQMPLGQDLRSYNGVYINAARTTEILNIHPYFYNVWAKVWSGRTSNDGIDSEYRMIPMISFYFPEHLTMFALAWNP